MLKQDGEENAMTYRGHVEHGAVVLDEPASLPEGAKVRLEITVEQTEELTVGQMLMRHAGKVKGLPSDLARNHDHYLHGTPRK